MTLVGPIALATLAKIAAVLGGLVVVAYILKLRRRRYEVPFSKLWQRVLREKESTSLWRHLKRLISLLVQLVFLALLIGAATDPRLGQASTSGRNVVIIVDASASMKAVDEGTGKPSRMALAKQEAKRLLAGLGGADVAMIVRMDGQTTALSRFESDVPRLLKIVDGIEASDTPADLPRALQAGADALRGRKHPLIVIIGDGAYRDDAKAEIVWEKRAAANETEAKLGIIDLSGIEVTYVPIGKQSRNIGIVAFNVRRYFQNKLSYEVLVEIENFGTEPEAVKFTLFAGTEAVDVKTLELQPGERQRKIYPDLGGGDDRQLMAKIEPQSGADAFPLDDLAYALLPERRKQKVLLVSADNLYLEGALLLDPNITVEKITPADYPKELAEGALAGYDAMVFDSYTPDALPPAPAAMYFGVSGDKSPFTIRGQLKRPFITETEGDHPVMRWVTLSDVNLDKSAVFSPQEGDIVLAKSIRDPVVIAGKRDGKKLIAYGFGLDGTDLMLRVAFPVLIVNTLDWFAGDDAELITTYRTGHTWYIPVDAEEKVSEVTVHDPSRRELKAPVTEGRASFYGRHVGVYGIDAGDRWLAVAANLSDPVESRITPQPELTLGGKKLGAPPTFKPSVTRSIWVWLVLGALVLSAIEWATYNRRITV